MAPSFFETKRYGSVSAKMRRFIRNGINDDTILLKKHIVWYCRCFCFTGRYLHKEPQHHTVKKESRHGMVMCPPSSRQAKKQKEYVN